MKPDFNRMARTLIKGKIHFTTRGTEPRFEIEGEYFTTEELIKLSRENNMTVLKISQMVKTKRTKSKP